MKRKLLVVAVVVGVMTFLAAAFAYAMPMWADDFESYAPGTVMDNVNGWKGWAGDPAAAGIITDTMAHTGSNSMSVVGFQDVVHEYTGYTSGEYDYIAWTYVPAGLTGQQYFILLNTYSDTGTNNWSTQLLMDATAGVIQADGMVFTGSATLITDQWVELRVNINLDTDTQTLYYNGTSFGSGSWTEGASGGGASNIGAVDLWGNGASIMFYDDLSLLPAGTVNTISANLTVSDDGSCGTSNTISVPENSTVTYCYQVTNTGNITYDTHMVMDDQQGTVLPTTAYELAPGESFSFTQDAPFTNGVLTSMMTWTAWVSGTGVAATGVATATVSAQPTDVVLTSFAGNGTTLWTLPLVSLSVLVVLAAAMVLRRRFQN